MFGDLLGMMGNYENRCVGRWDSDDHKRMVSTARVTDGSRPYETAFKHPEYNDGSMVIVEAYDSQEDALKGHEKWLSVMTDGPLPEKLVDCCNAQIAQMRDALSDPDEQWTVHLRKSAA